MAPRPLPNGEEVVRATYSLPKSLEARFRAAAEQAHGKEGYSKSIREAIELWLIAQERRRSRTKKT